MQNLRLIIAVLGTGLLGQVAFPQQAAQPDAATKKKADAYFNYSMGHLYAELASQFGNRGAFLNKAIDHYRAALEADPGARFLGDELADLYLQSGRLAEAVKDSEARLRDHPDDLNARRILARIYTRMVGDPQSGRLNQNMLKKAIEEYGRITAGDPQDVEAWLTLGRLHRVAQSSVEAEKAFKKALEIDENNDDAMAGLAMIYSDLGDPKRSAEMFQKVAEKSPNLRTLTQLAGAYEQMRDYALAAETLKRALGLSPDNAELKRALAQNLMLSEKLDEALELYKELAAEDEKDAQARLRLSQIYRQKRDFDNARKASEEARALAPDNLDVIYNEVGILEAEGKAAQAIEGLKRILDETKKPSYSASEKSNRAFFLERLGRLYRQAENFPEAVKTFEELGALDDTVAATAAAQVADTLRQAKDYSNALARSDAARAKWPEDRTIRLVRAAILSEMGRAGEAAADLKKMLGGEDDRETWLSVAQAYEKAKDYREMGKALDEAEKLSETNEDKEAVYFTRGAMFEKMQNFEASEREFRRVLELNPESASALNYLGYMLADRGVRLNEAQTMIEKAVEKDPTSGAYLDSLGWVYFKLGRLEDAETQLKRALDFTASDPTINDHLGDVYARQGRLKDAVEQWQRALNLWESSGPGDRDPKEIAKVQKKLESAKVRLAKESK